MISRRAALSLSILAAICAVLPSAVFADVVPFTTQNFKDAQAANKPILVEIHASWCPTCKTQKQILDNVLLPEPKYKNLVVLRVDFDSQKDIVKEFGARMQSTLIVYKGKTEVARAVGSTDPDTITTLLDKAF